MCTDIARGSGLELLTTSLSNVVALLSQSEINFGHLRLVQLHQNLPQSKDVESILVTFCLHDRRQHRRRQLFIG